MFSDVEALPLTNIIYVATDGNPAIEGRYRGFSLAYLKQAECILSTATATTTSSTTRITRSRNNTIEEIEKRLSIWMIENTEETERSEM
ncbi:hypothetical protein TNCV_2050451 [Trichonephila clavipes]|nr:hypothetical protein TNCV_2050451 [Trichonephila clavipes]